MCVLVDLKSVSMALIARNIQKREEYRRLQTVKGNIDQILRRSEPQRRKEQSHER